MALTVVMDPKPTFIKWKDAKHGSVYRCGEGEYLVLCNQSNQATGLNTSVGSARSVGDTWSPGSESRWIEVNATMTVTGDV